MGIVGNVPTASPTGCTPIGVVHVLDMDRPIGRVPNGQTQEHHIHQTPGPEDAGA